jgi:dUTP pyrophosphatase
MNLKVKKLHPMAKLPVAAHPGSDLGYDIFALEDTYIGDDPTPVRTGIAVELDGFGFLMQDRSSVASSGLFTTAGVIDAGYRGELKVLLSNKRGAAKKIIAGQKIAQLVPLRPLTNFAVEEVKELAQTTRGEKGFGSSGN